MERSPVLNCVQPNINLLTKHAILSLVILIKSPGFPVFLRSHQSSTGAPGHGVLDFLWSQDRIPLGSTVPVFQYTQYFLFSLKSWVFVFLDPRPLALILGPQPQAPRPSVPHLVGPGPQKYCKKKFMNKHITYSRYTYSTLKYYTYSRYSKSYLERPSYGV